MRILYAMTIGFVLDCILGDPHALPHPVRWIGRLISFLDRHLNGQPGSLPDGQPGSHSDGQPDSLSVGGPGKKKGHSLSVLGGVLLVLSVLTATGAAVFFFRLLTYRAGFWAGIIGDGLLFYYCIAPKSLYEESMAVLRALPNERAEGEKDSLAPARERLSMIVGRDTERLTEEGVIKAAVETVAENTSDGVTAPLLYMALGGPLLCFLYKAVNTMDSMVGYHNDRYEYFGKAAAVTDDIWNYIPSRLTAYSMLLGAMLLSPFCPCLDWKRGVRIYRRDRRKHKSPNCAQTESVCAGVLGIELAGDASYFGRTVHKPRIGDALRPVERADIRRANLLMYVSTVIMLLICMGMRIVLSM